MIGDRLDPEIARIEENGPGSETVRSRPAIWFVYMVRTQDGCYYTGISTDPERRYREHCSSGPRAARFFRAHPPEALVFVQKIGSRSLASQVEYRLKAVSHAMKQRIAAEGTLRYASETGRLL